MTFVKFVFSRFNSVMNTQFLLVPRNDVPPQMDIFLVFSPRFAIRLSHDVLKSQREREERERDGRLKDAIAAPRRREERQRERREEEEEEDSQCLYFNPSFTSKGSSVLIWKRRGR